MSRNAPRPRRQRTIRRGILYAVCAVLVPAGCQAPAPTTPEWVAKVRAGDTFGNVELRRLPSFKLTLAGQTRNAFVAPRRLAVPLRLPAGARLELSAGLRCAEGARCEGLWRFRVAAEGQPALLDEERGAAWIEHAPEAFPLSGPPAEWLVQQVQPAHSANPLKLVFEAELVPGSVPPGAEPPVAFWGEPLPVAPAPLTNVLLISLDTLRADRVGAYGYTRPTTPHIDRLAAASVRFSTAVTSSPWTTPAHMSLFTGLDPSHHHVMPQAAAERRHALAPEVATLAQLLRAGGRRTAAVTGGGNVSAGLGFDRGFDAYQDAHIKATPEFRALARQRLAELRDAPFFLFVHTYAAHAPYERLEFAHDLLPATARAEWQQRYSLEWLTRVGRRALPRAAAGLGGRLVPASWSPPEPPSVEPPPGLPDDDGQRILHRHGRYRADVTSALYDGGVRQADELVGELLADLERLGLRGRTLVIVTSDHGEEFGEHDQAAIWDAHCNTYFEEVLRVPLIVHVPGAAPRVVTQQARLIDVLPTLLDWLGLPAPQGLDGRSLRALAEGRALPEAAALSEGVCEGPESKALRTATHKYVAQYTAADLAAARPLPSLEWLYDLRHDPGEKEDLFRADPERFHALRARMQALLADPRRRPAAAPTLEAGPAILETLKSLGYVQ